MFGEFTWETWLWTALAAAFQVFVVYMLTKEPKRSIEGKHVIITGGSSGIGLSMGILCAQSGANVTIIARDPGRLEKAIACFDLNRKTKDQKFGYKSVDISNGYEAVSRALAESETERGNVYMLVNCAGLAVCGVYEEVSIEDAKKMMDINYWGTYYCTRYVLPKMKAANDGIIVLTASQAALFGIYGYGPYAASKFALRAMAETLSMETRHLNVSITLALPNDTDTPGFENEEKTKPKETKIISEGGGISKPDDVAQQILEDALDGSIFSVLGFESWFITVLCCGMATWGNIGLVFLQVFLMGPLRLLGLALQWKFSRIVKKCAKEREM